MPAETILHARWIIPIVPHAQVLEQHSLVINDGLITALLPTNEARQLARQNHTREIELPNHALTPGFVNAHTHLAMNLLRGVADDLPLMTWLQEHIWPLENQLLSDAFVFDGSQLACAELIKSGVTCFNDMYFFPAATLRAAEEAGLRASIGLTVIDFPTAWGKNADDYLQKGQALHEEWHIRYSERSALARSLRHELNLLEEWHGNPRMSFMLAPHAPYTVSDAPLERIRTLAEKLDIGIHMHVHETAFEVAEAMRLTGERPLARLHRLGLLNKNFLAVHMTQLIDAEIDMLAERGVHIAHCPESNLKLASGIAPLARLKERGINVAIGTDGAASNNDLDLLGETRTAALLAKGFSGDAAAIPAADALHMATLGGARALGLDARIGSLEPGKAADFIAIDLGHIETQPVFDPIAQIIYAAGRHQVTHLWVAGRMLMNERRLMSLNEDELLANAQEWQEKIQQLRTSQ
ncbi:MAG: amidohydrolase family protein [Halothiobacillaceae bacterium]